MNAPPLTALLVGVLLIGVSAIADSIGDSLPKGAATDNRTIEVTPPDNRGDNSPDGLKLSRLLHQKFHFSEAVMKRGESNGGF